VTKFSRASVNLHKPSMAALGAGEPAVSDYIGNQNRAQLRVSLIAPLFKSPHWRRAVPNIPMERLSEDARRRLLRLP
jgi:hypothetical protein